ncbi:uncharacterized protein N7515_002423 [Penicillium bovifimosum]|uniref:Mitochondrial division protein 1 n=1 Tax=Penicillium bovifimosum TaxID=126998 RepID=A0A9W9HBJ0_9EURO|nr:uncharacterized protein N7515_002423 [Penicillium bovifimosum]KAJ5143636.1 hypothetical protein N7515_002423 [Penicillium bovifimosum]
MKEEAARESRSWCEYLGSSDVVHVVVDGDGDNAGSGDTDADSRQIFRHQPSFIPQRPQISSVPGLPEGQQAEMEIEERVYEWYPQAAPLDLPLGADIVEWQKGYLVLCERERDVFPGNHRDLFAFDVTIGALKALPMRWGPVDDGPVRAMASYAPYEMAQSLITGHDNGILRVWKLESGQLVRRLTGISGTTCLEVDGNTAIAGSHGGAICVWNLVVQYTDYPRKVMRGHDGAVHCLQSKYGILISGGEDKTVRCWELQTGVCTHVLPGYSLPIHFVCLEGLDFVTVGTGRGTGSNITHWRLRPNDLGIQGLYHGYDAAPEPTTHLRLASGYSVSVREDGLVSIWHLRSHQFTTIHVGCSAVVALDNKGPVVVLAMANGSVWLVDKRIDFCASILDGVDRIWKVRVISTSQVMVAYERGGLCWIATFDLTC